ncbi:hypothetical protein [Paenisporosarcina sp. OV554]|uniref:hypothetical protein n=1 Tax=Paenisporosarcina sp. OV554 TaxID=2135694 RepID=UPI000D359797|nr:hypothetical protein [Paenisporosarcina sp. OV554]PUB09602.1 hypothetical protein C8K15_1275 [Paenisporosarcina sp. OV554]
MSSTVLDWTACFPIKEDIRKVEDFYPSLAQKVTLGLSSGVVFGSIVSGSTAFASANGVIPSAFQPVKDLLISMAEPLCYVMFVWGCIEVICKRPASGLDRMKYAAIGFIGINLIPVIMETIKAAAPQ